MERRKKLHIPEAPRQKVQREVGEEQFQYLLQLLTTYENNNLQRTKEVLDELATYKNGVAALAQTFLRMEQQMATHKNGVAVLSETFTKMAEEVAHIMKILGYYDDPETGDFKRPVLRQDPKQRFAV